ncbi:Putative Ethyl tert-butyl ether degradation protein [Erwinia billingiae Eb661]|uniref:Putative Ethyl tert-butyl ether degradation protein n=1 Tax=Erwinia billingiae (strain Eb661) TaxID=634500 RepID=D8MTI0_ERWBE|nr:EthD family reductase [Erwinia billingiae]CAX60137.1 Putative Ethyl tert-butyl ether degradation protein [Erwinia billingiae Eb661]
MIKYSVLYPTTENGHFDHDYYRDVHLPLIKARMGDYLVSYSIDKILSAPDGSPAPYVAACHLICHSAEALQKGMAGHVDEIVGDVDNFTNIKSVKWIAEVVV